MADIAINDQTKTTTVALTDVIPLYDVSAGHGRGALIRYLPISDATQTALDSKQATKSTGTVTLSSGLATISDNDGIYAIDTEGAASTDDLETITSISANKRVLIYPANDDRTIVVKNSANILLNGGIDFTMNNANDTIELLSKGGGVFVEISRSSNGD